MTPNTYINTIYWIIFFPNKFFIYPKPFQDFIISYCFPLSISPQWIPKHKVIESPKGTLSALNSNFGKTFLVWLALKKSGFILYDWDKGLLSSIIDFVDKKNKKKFWKILNFNYYLLTSDDGLIYKLFFSKLLEGIIFIPTSILSNF